MIADEAATTVAAEIARLYAEPGLRVVIPESLSKVWVAIRNLEDSTRKQALSSAFQLTFERRGDRLEVRQSPDPAEPKRIEVAIARTWAKAKGGPVVAFVKSRVKAPTVLQKAVRGIFRQDSSEA